MKLTEYNGCQVREVHLSFTYNEEYTMTTVTTDCMMNKLRNLKLIAFFRHPHPEDQHLSTVLHAEKEGVNTVYIVHDVNHSADIAGCHNGEYFPMSRYRNVGQSLRPMEELSDEELKDLDRRARIAAHNEYAERMMYHFQVRD